MVLAGPRGGAAARSDVEERHRAAGSTLAPWALSCRPPCATCSAEKSWLPCVLLGGGDVAAAYGWSPLPVGGIGSWRGTGWRT